MTGWRLQLRRPPALRLDLRGITPLALAGLGAGAIEQWPVGHGRSFVPVAEFFSVQALSSDALVLEGDLSRVDRIGWKMDGGQMVVEGSAGDQAGACMIAGTLQIKGSAGVLAACEMAGGTLSIDGDAGDFGASTLPGSMDGMRGGTLVVKGNAGDRFGDRMRRGTVLVFGNAGDFLASRLVAGTIAVGGRAGAQVGYGMRRGSVVFAAGAKAAELPATFLPAGADAAVIWQLLARELARHGGPFEALPSRGIERHLGDRGTGGKGELIFVRSGAC
jgi:formylmethanofuran dehydrogenase subunit C